MNITFMIGNGFDRNLGLATTYADFVEYYKRIEGSTENLKEFRKHIEDNEELWSSAELALGLYTGELEPGKAADFSECHMDICEELAVYLKSQQLRINYDENVENIKNAFKRMNSIQTPFPTQERNILNNAISKRNDEIRLFDFICFNYTDTLDRCLDIVRKSPDTLGTHKSGNNTITHSIGQICHVHGTVNKEMVFGVNDETQVANNDLFACENGDLYKNFLIKQKANESFKENTDGRAAKILNESNIIYIYGMSIGETDRLWWERVCKWLETGNDRHLIIQRYVMPPKGVFPIQYQVSERENKREFLNYCSLNTEKRNVLESRIHITNDNIFDAIRNIAIIADQNNSIDKDRCELINKSVSCDSICRHACVIAEATLVD